jgi:hypothetical protein
MLSAHSSLQEQEKVDEVASVYRLVTSSSFHRQQVKLKACDERRLASYEVLNSQRRQMLFPWRVFSSFWLVVG